MGLQLDTPRDSGRSPHRSPILQIQTDPHFIGFDCCRRPERRVINVINHRPRIVHDIPHRPQADPPGTRRSSSTAYPAPAPHPPLPGSDHTRYRAVTNPWSYQSRSAASRARPVVQRPGPVRALRNADPPVQLASYVYCANTDSTPPTTCWTSTRRLRKSYEKSVSSPVAMSVWVTCRHCRIV